MTTAAPEFTAKSVSQTVVALKAAGEDFEWYPTTDEILKVIARKIRGADDDYSRHGHIKILDIGAGDGRALVRLQEMLVGVDSWNTIHLDQFAIEKSMVHLANMPKSIVVVGTEFFEQTLVDKKFDVVFCNPPYSEYEEWAYRILKECDAQNVYLVIPRRWRESQRLTALVEKLEIKVESLGEFDFEHAPRQARAKVEIVRFRMYREAHAAFDAAIEEMLPELDQFECKVSDKHDDSAWDSRVAKGGSLIDSLVLAYDGEMAELYETYRGVVKINPAILKELGVTKANILAGMREKIKGLKNKYWGVLFDHLTDITKRFATKQRKAFLDSLTSKTVIDFTYGNVRSMLIWICKWSSDYCDEQVIELFKSMAEHANVVNYKSNERVFKHDHWRIKDDQHTHYKLEYRIVLQHAGGINTSSYSWESRNGLEGRAHDFLCDFITVANNLGFVCNDRPDHHQWRAGKTVELWLADGSELMDVRAFKNGNLHIRVSKRLMLAINIQVGKLLGWLHSADQAVQELEPDAADVGFVADVFQLSNRIEPSKLLRLEHTPHPA